METEQTPRYYLLNMGRVWRYGAVCATCMLIQFSCARRKLAENNTTYNGNLPAVRLVARSEYELRKSRRLAITQST